MVQPGLFDEFDNDERPRRKPTAADARRAEATRRNGRPDPGDQVRRAAAGLDPIERLPETPPGGPTAAEVRDEAIERVGVNNKEDAAAFERRALIVVARGKKFTSEHVVAAYPELEAVREKRVFGNVLTRLKNAGLIVATEQFIPSSRKSCHAGPKRVWQPTGMPTSEYQSKGYDDDDDDDRPAGSPAPTDPPGELGAAATVCHGQGGPPQPGGG